MGSLYGGLLKLTCLARNLICKILRSLEKGFIGVAQATKMGSIFRSDLVWAHTLELFAVNRI